MKSVQLFLFAALLLGGSACTNNTNGEKPRVEHNDDISDDLDQGIDDESRRDRDTLEEDTL